jgi:transcriptional regulator
MTVAFDSFTSADVRDLIAEYPLAWLTAPSGEASLLPLLGEYDGEGNLVRLLGHIARGNPLFETLSVAPRATILFTGPQGYVSPCHAGKRDWGPTWNYAKLVIAADIAFEPDSTDAALSALTEAMEQGRWTPAELGARYDGMARQVVAFRAHVRTLNGRFKLGQDETRPVFEAILRNHPDAALVRWMQRFAGRE